MYNSQEAWNHKLDYATNPTLFDFVLLRGKDGYEIHELYKWKFYYINIISVMAKSDHELFTEKDEKFPSVEWKQSWRRVGY